uniref:Synaptopodin 2b n=1 Tax=Pygocentrus nattereri TaxID=42514 RepID=A0AAR2KPR5_PYGNA
MRFRFRIRLHLSVQHLGATYISQCLCSSLQRFDRHQHVSLVACHLIFLGLEPWTLHKEYASFPPSLPISLSLSLTHSLSLSNAPPPPSIAHYHHPRLVLLPYSTDSLRRSEGQSEKHLKEAKSKCKRIAQLLTAAPNPESKGVLMFKKRRQRARKFTLVSYGTRKPEDDSFEDEYGFEDDNIGKDFRFSLPATSESEFDEDFCFNVQGQGAALNVFYNYEPQEERTLTNYNWEKMEQLPHTKGKGVLMFAQRRQRIDEITAQHEEMRQKGIPVEAFVESETVAPSMPTLREENVPVHQDVHVKQQPQYQEQQYQQQMYQQPNTGVNGLDPYQVSSMSKSLVSNRTAKPFGGLNHAPIPYSPVRGVPNPTPKKSENIFKVPIPVNTSPQVWSPTGDIIASRDERIAVPAIKTGILPEAKRRANKADSRHVPPEEDYLSLGAEACNFMQAPTVRQKHPPPVLPKPAINPPATKPWAPSPTQPLPQQHMPAWVPHNPSASYQAAWASEPQQAPVSIKTPTTPHAAPSQSRTPWTKPQIDANSVASCPPQQGKTGLSDGPTLKGKGAELFARRQSRMEKFVVDAKTVQANRANRPPSPTLSMPSTWKYSPNIRAPPPVSYNPIVSPFYPLAAQKQPTSVTSPKPQANKEKPKPPPKHLSVVDVMKHQPYHHLQPPSSGHFLSPTLSPSPAAPATHKVSSSTSAPLFSNAGNVSLSPSSFSLNNEAVSRYSLPIAPRPRFSAKKSAVGGKQWKPVVMQH